MADHAVFHKNRGGEKCGPLTNDMTECKDPNVCRCCACGDYIDGLDARKLSRVRATDAYWERRRMREGKGLLPPFPRLMSFALTERQLLDGTKDVTRRLGWDGLVRAPKPVRLIGVRKAMGIPKGESIYRLRAVHVLDARFERLDAIDVDDCRREGFPEMSPAEFVAMAPRQLDLMEAADAR